jgi:hypothetical protein
MRRYQAAAMVALVAPFVVLPLSGALARDRMPAGTALAQAADVPPEPAPRKRPPVRIRIHPLAQTHPGPNSVRQCKAWLEPEYRPSGTVIVPRMSCWWEG